jgi:hypothetical protein
MTEAEWLACPKVWPMLEFIGGRDRGAVARLFSWLGFRSVYITTRKLRLFACACCRLNPRITRVPQLNNAVATSERFADGLATLDELVGAADQVRLIFPPGEGTAVSFAAACAAAVASTMSSSLSGHTGMDNAVAWASKTIETDLVTRVYQDDSSENEPAIPSTDYHTLLRHIVGNPFCVYRAPTPWTSAVIKLAEAQYAGEDCSFALHDALLESGFPDLAAHFMEQGHPKGCWAVDLLLGKG